jgi:hypothetical protein
MAYAGKIVKPIDQLAGKRNEENGRQWNDGSTRFAHNGSDRKENSEADVDVERVLRQADGQ